MKGSCLLLALTTLMLGLAVTALIQFTVWTDHRLRIIEKNLDLPRPSTGFLEDHRYEKRHELDQ